MFNIHCRKGINEFLFGMSVNKAEKSICTYTEELPDVYDGGGVHILKYETFGVSLFFADNELSMVELHAPNVVKVLDVNLELGTAVRQAVKNNLGLILSTHVELDWVYADPHGLVFCFDDEYSGDNKLDSIYVCRTTHAKHFENTRCIYHKELKKNPPELTDSDDRLKLLTPITSVFDSLGINYNIDFDAIGWGVELSSIYSMWIYRHYPATERGTLETADYLYQYDSLKAFRKSDIVKGDKVNFKDSAIVTWMDPSIPTVRLGVGDAIENLKVFVKLKEGFWLISESSGWVLEVHSKKNLQYLWSRAATSILDEDL